MTVYKQATLHRRGGQKIGLPFFVWEIMQSLTSNNARINSVWRTHNCKPTFAHPCILAKQKHISRRSNTIFRDIALPKTWVQRLKLPKRLHCFSIYNICSHVYILRKEPENEGRDAKIQNKRYMQKNIPLEGL